MCLQFTIKNKGWIKVRSHDTKANPIKMYNEPTYLVYSTKRILKKSKILKHI